LTIERPHKNLELWKEALIQYIYELANQCPKDEEFGLKSQIKRVVVSIPYHRK